MNPVTEWVWSARPVHDPLVDLETFVLAQEVARHRERSRAASGLNSDPQAKNIYRFRSYLFCAACGRRMKGKTRRGIAHYVCAPKKGYRPEGHPAVTPYIREDHLLREITRFLAARVFGAYRHALLSTSLQTLQETQRQEHDGHIANLQRAIADTDTKSKRLLRSLEATDEPDPDLLRDINERRAELRAIRTELERQLDEALNTAQQTTKPGSTTCPSAPSTSTTCPTTSPVACSRPYAWKSTTTTSPAQRPAASP